MPVKNVDPRRAYLKIPEWPERDRAALEAGLQPADDLLEDPRYAEGLAKPTINKAIDGYSRWLGFLLYRGELNLEEEPAERPTLERIKAFFNLMRELGNTDYTIIGRLNELRTMLAIMGVETGFEWLTRPAGVPLRSRLRMAKQHKEIHSPAESLQWALGLMDSALSLAPRRRCVQFRDGLMFGVWALRGPRLRAFAALQIGEHLWKQDGRFWLALHEGDQKNERVVEYPLPSLLEPYMRRYLDVERRELLGNKLSAALWIGWQGEPMKEAGVQKRVYWRSEKKFPTRFGPHRFRHALATSASLLVPDQPGLGPAILGITGAVNAKHYDLSKRTVAARQYHAVLKEERATLEANGLSTDDPSCVRLSEQSGPVTS